MPDWLYWTLVVLASSPVIFVIGWAVFDDWDGFKEAVWFWLKPDIVSWFDGTGWDDITSEWKMLAFLLCSAGSVFGVHMLAQWLFF